MAVMAFECLTGRRPFDANEHRGSSCCKSARIRSLSPPQVAPRARRLRRLVSRGPPSATLDQRFQSARELADDLRRILPGDDVGFGRPARTARLRRAPRSGSDRRDGVVVRRLVGRGPEVAAAGAQIGLAAARSPAPRPRRPRCLRRRSRSGAAGRTGGRRSTARPSVKREARTRAAAAPSRLPPSPPPARTSNPCSTTAAECNMTSDRADTTHRLDETGKPHEIDWPSGHPLGDAGSAVRLPGHRAGARHHRPGPRSDCGARCCGTVAAARRDLPPGARYIAHDLGSTNGTHVNGRRLEYAPLSEGDVIRLGDVLGVVARVAREADAEAPRSTRSRPTWCLVPGSRRSSRTSAVSRRAICPY